ncbi:MAG: DUF202 domain-containing protein [Rhodomicrobium sp.]
MGANDVEGRRSPHRKDAREGAQKSTFGEHALTRNFTEHSANERTFLAWIRTAIAVIGFGFVLEKFNLFILALASSASAEVGKAIRADRLSGPIGRYEGLAFMLTGLMLIGLGYWRFIRNEKLIETGEPHRPGGQAEIAVSAILAGLVAVYCASLVVG